VKQCADRCRNGNIPWEEEAFHLWKDKNRCILVLTSENPLGSARRSLPD